MDEEDRATLDKKWDKLHIKIKAKHSDFEEPKRPFVSCNVIKDFNEIYAKVYDKEKFIAM